MSDLIMGIDEVGRGSWAGPLVVGAVVFETGQGLAGLADSKKLSKKAREELNLGIKRESKAIGIGWVDARTIDSIGLAESLRLATERAFLQIPETIRSRVSQIIIDGTIRLLDDERVITMIKADDKIKAVSAASIVAKVARDDYMKSLSNAFTDYDFASNVGYGTAKHSESLMKFGPIDGIHRKSFAPVAKVYGLIAESKDRISETSGRKAENVAAEYLIKAGHEIIDRNWKTRLCEIDIVSMHDGVLYFNEVKYRHNDSHGDGLAAITKTKLRQMEFAAKIYLSNKERFIKFNNVKLSAISVSGQPPKVDDFIDNVA